VPEAWLFGVVLLQSVFETWVVLLLVWKFEPEAAPEVWQLEILLLREELEPWVVQGLCFHSADEPELVLGAWTSGAVLPQEPLEVFLEAYRLELEAFLVELVTCSWESVLGRQGYAACSARTVSYQLVPGLVPEETLLLLELAVVATEETKIVEWASQPLLA